jgi:hypothetical protein
MPVQTRSASAAAAHAVHSPPPLQRCQFTYNQEGAAVFLVPPEVLNGDGNMFPLAAATGVTMHDINFERRAYVIADTRGRFYVQAASEDLVEQALGLNLPGVPVSVFAVNGNYETTASTNLLFPRYKGARHLSNGWVQVSLKTVCACNSDECERDANEGYLCTGCEEECYGCNKCCLHGCTCDAIPVYPPQECNIIRSIAQHATRHDVILSPSLARVVHEGLDSILNVLHVPNDAVASYSLRRTFACAVCGPSHTRTFHNIDPLQWDGHVLSAEHIGRLRDQ